MRLVAVVLLAMASFAYAKDYASAGPSAVDVLTYTWKDTRRNDRPVPVRIYLPRNAHLAPVVVFSHDLGGSRDDYEYFGRHVASYGHLAMHVTHVGTDSDAIRRSVAAGQSLSTALLQSSADVESLLNRPKDISFAVNQLANLTLRESPLYGTAETRRIAVAGHASGACSVLAAMQSDTRISCAIAMAMPAAKDPGAYSQITAPILLITSAGEFTNLLRPSTRDTGLAQFRLCERFLLALEGADRCAITGGGGLLDRSGQPASPAVRQRDRTVQRSIAAVSAAFLDAFSRNDPVARDWLSSEEGIKAMIGATGTWECEAPAPAASTRPGAR